MNRRYPRSIIVTICIALSLAVAATVMSGFREAPASGLKTHNFSAPVTTARGPGYRSKL